LGRNQEARHRWESYATFIKDTKKETPQLEADAKLVTDQLKNPQLPETKRAELVMRRNDLQSKLDLNKALLEAPSNAMWCVYGEQNKASKNWSERHFDVQGGSKLSLPKPNDTVTAIDNVFIRSSAPEWNNQTQDLKVGPISGYITPGDRVVVLQVLDTNSPTDENAYYFIRLARLPKE
jgi:hypothetical protein